MFTRIILILALLFGAVPVQAAGPYKGFYYGAENPAEIADLVERSLARDPSGRTLISAENCRTRGGCAAPINYLESFQTHDPHGGWTLENLAEKLRTLVIKHDVKGKYQMDRIVYGGSGSPGRTDVSGMSRTFARGEAAWVNPETGRPVLAENCANPVGQRIDIVCVYVNFEVRNPSEYAVAWERVRRQDDPCFAFRKTTALYQADTPTTVWQTVRPGCIGKPCDFGPFNRLYGYTAASQGTVELQGPGTYQFRLSPDEVLALCVKTTDSRSPSSFTAGAIWQQDYARQIDGAMHARIFYDTNDMGRAGLTLGQPKARMFWASDAAAEAAIYRSFER